MAGEKTFSLGVYCLFKNIAYICGNIRRYAAMIDILINEAKCFILLQREPENSYRIENEECCTVVSAYKGADFCHIPFSRFLRTSVGRI